MADGNLQPRAMGRVALIVKASPRGTVLGKLHQSGAFKALFPRGRGMQAVLINTAGGLTGGDRFSLSAVAEAGCALALTTQAAERVYGANRGAARVENRLELGAGARMDWLPQETILFENSAFERRLEVHMAKNARFLMVEPLIFGRAAMGERLTRVGFSDRVEIHRGGKLLYLDALRFQGDLAAQMARPHTGNGAGAMASVVLAAPNAEAHLGRLRALVGPQGGVSLRDPGLLALRLLAADGYHLRQTLLPVLAELTAAPLPKCWMT